MTTTVRFPKKSPPKSAHIGASEGEGDQISLLQRLTGRPPFSAMEQATLESANLQRLSDSRAALLAGSVSTDDAAKLLGVSPRTADERSKHGALLALEAEGTLHFPLWQFDPMGSEGVVPGLPDILRTLAVSPFAQALWLTRPNPTFEGRTPLQTLKSGETERVLAAAQAVGVI